MDERKPAQPGMTEEELRAMDAETDPAIWKPRVRELLLQVRAGTIGRSAIFVHVGALREKLLVVMDEPESQAKDHRGFSMALFARELLALWSDPRDEALISQWLDARGNFAYRAPAGIAADTLPALQEKWRDAHFTKEGFPDPAQRTANWITVLARTEDHALLQHEVRYAHWSYTLALVVVREQGLWTVKLVMTTMWEHYDR